MSRTVKWVEATRTTGGTEATTAAMTGGTCNPVASMAWMALPATDRTAPPIKRSHGYQAPGLRARATAAMVATTISPSVISGHTHGMTTPDRAAKSFSPAYDSQKANTPIRMVPVIDTMPTHFDGRVTVMVVGSCGIDMRCPSGGGRLDAASPARCSAPPRALGNRRALAGYGRTD